MKIAVGSRPYDGPWGGGNRFVSSLCEALARNGHVVVHDLDDNDIDFILLTDPRTRAPNVCFGAGAILRYLALRNPNAVVIHRVNECDERKGEPFINGKLVRANYVADATVFVGEWLVGLPVWRNNIRAPWRVIRNGADTRFFNRRSFKPWTGQGPMRLVTHHWGYHRLKGFDVYSELDRILEEPEWAARIAFTYIGNLPDGFAFRNARYVRPLDGVDLATELQAHHAYITASVNEPGGNHQNEGALCGLPLLYRQSGCMPEYCAGYGVGFSGVSDLRAALTTLFKTYDDLVPKMPAYPHTAERMTQQWIALLDSLLESRDAIVSKRNLWRSPWTALLNQVM